MQLFHFHQGNVLNRLIHSEFWLFEISVWLHTFAVSMVAIFIPIFLLQIGYSIGEVMIFYIIYNVVDVPLNFFARFLTRKMGARWVIILGSVAAILLFISLFELTSGNWPLLILTAIFAAFYDTFYWVAHIYFFMKCSKDDENISRDTGIMRIIKRFAGMTAPALGALILVSWDRGALLLISVAVLVLSILPLFKIKNIDDKPRRKQKSFKEFFSSWDISRDYISSMLLTLHRSAEGILWPIFIYRLFVDIESVAILPVIVSATAIMFIYVAGKTKKQRRDIVMAMASMAIALTWIARLFIDDNAFYYISVFLIGFFTIFVGIPLDSYLFEKGEKIDTLSASTYRNTANMFANVILFGVLSIMVNVFDTSFILASLSMFVVAGLSYFVGQGIASKKV
ncbi:MFS transporter [Patescibacteria group bacterium]